MDNEKMKTAGAVIGVATGGYVIGRTVEAVAKWSWKKIKPMLKKEEVVEQPVEVEEEK